MENTENIIQHSSINLQYPTQRLARKGNLLIEEIFESSIMPQISIAIEDNVPDETHFEFQKLEIDIGKISEKELKSELGNRIKIALQKALESKLSLSLPKETAASSSTGKNNYSIEALKAFLLYGYLPKWFKKTGSFVDLLSSILDHYPDDLKNFLLDFSTNETVKRRLLDNLDDPLRDKIFHLFEPVHASWILSLKQALLQSWTGGSFRFHGMHEFAAGVDYFILDYLLQNRSPAFSRKNFSEKLSQYLSGLAKDDRMIEKLVDRIDDNDLAESLKAIHSPIHDLQHVSALEKPDPVGLAMLLNTEEFRKKELKKAELKAQLRALFGDDLLLMEFFHKLNDQGAKRLLVLSQPGAVKRVVRLIESFVKEMSSDTADHVESISFKKLALLTVMHLEKSQEKVLDKEFLLSLIASSVSSNLNRFIRSSAFLKFVEGQKDLSHKKVKSLTGKKDQVQKIWQAQRQLSIASVKSEAVTAQEQSMEQARLLVIRRKIVSDYLLTGYLSSSQVDFSFHEIQSIFADLLRIKDDFLVHVIRLSSDKEMASERINQLIDAQSGSFLTTYLQHFYKKEYDILTAQISTLEKLLSLLGISETKDWQPKLILKSLIVSKGPSSSDALEAALIRHWVDMLSSYSDRTSLFIGAKKKSREVLKLFSGLDTSTKAQISEDLIKEAGKLLSIKSIENGQLAVDTSAKMKDITQSLFVYQQLDDRFLHTLFVKYPQHQLLLLDAFEIHLHKSEWQIVLKSAAKSSQLKEIIAVYQKHSTTSFDILSTSTSVQKTKQPKKDQESYSEARRLGFSRLLRDDHAFEQFITSWQDAKIASSIIFKEKMLQSALEALLYFTPKVVSKKGERHVWRSTIIRYAMRQYVVDPVISVARFVAELKQHLVARSGVSGSPKIADDILLELKESKQKELVKLFGAIVRKKVQPSISKDEKELETEITQLVAALRFYATYGYLPWWSALKDLSSLIEEVIATFITYPSAFREEIIKEEKATPLLSSLAQMLPDEHVTSIGNVIISHPELEPIWNKAIKKKRTVEGRDTTAKLKKRQQKLLEQEIPETEAIVRSLKTDPSQLPSLLYQYADRQLIRLLFARHLEVQKLIKQYLALSSYIHHRDATPPKWRLVVYTVAIDVIQQPSGKVSFDQQLIKYIKRKSDGIDWVPALKKLSELPMVDMPKALSQLLDQHYPSSSTRSAKEEDVKKHDVIKLTEGRLATEGQDAHSESARLLRVRRKVISSYLLSGHLDGSYEEFSRQDIQSIFTLLLQIKDDFLVQLIQQPGKAEQLAARIELLVDGDASSHISDYMEHFYAEEYHILTKLISALGQVLPIIERDQKEVWSAKLILKAIILSKGESSPDVLKGALITIWLDAISMYAEQPSLATSFKTDSKKWKPKEAQKLFSKLDKSTKVLIRERYMRFAEELLAIIRAGTSTTTDSETRFKAIAQSIFIYQQFDVEFVQNIIAKHPEHHYLFLRALELHLEKAEWKALHKILRPDDKVRSTLITYEKYASQANTEIASPGRKLKSDLSKTKKTHKRHIESDRLRYYQLQQDNTAFDRFIDSITTVELALSLHFKDKTIQSSLESLISFTPKATSKKSDRRIWRAMIIRYVLQKYVDDPAISASRFVSGLEQYVIIQLDFTERPKLAEDVLVELKESKRKDLSKLFSAIDKKEVRSDQRHKKQGSEPVDEITHLLRIVRFYSTHRYLPWWAAQKDLYSVINELLIASRNYPKIFIKEIVKENRAKKILPSIADRLPDTYLKRIGSAFSSYPEIKQLWEKALKKSKKKRETETQDSEPDYKTSLKQVIEQKLEGIEALVKSVTDDPRLIPSLLYRYSDAELMPMLFAQRPDIQRQMKLYLEFSSYIYHQGATPPKWRLAVYTIALDLVREKAHESTFDQKVIEYIEGNTDGINWLAALKKVSELPYVKLPKALALVIDQHFPKRAQQPILELKKDKPFDKKAPFDVDEDIEFEANISNAGLIIVWPFLTRLFEHFGFLKEGKFINTESQSRAVYILQYMVYNDVDYPEYELLLNKILVGMPLKVHLDTSTKLTQDEKEMTTSLLHGIIQNWEKVKNSSPEGIQETFLQREGLIQIQQDKTMLHIEKKGVDVLLESISWNIGLIKLPWMLKPLHINWL